MTTEKTTVTEKAKATTAKKAPVAKKTTKAAPRPPAFIAKEVKKATFNQFKEEILNPAKEWTTLGDFCKLHTIELSQGDKIKVAKFLKGREDFDTKANSNGVSLFKSEQLESFFEVDGGEL